MNFLHLIKLDSKFRRELEQFFNINLKNYKYVGGNGFDNASTCYIFSDGQEYFSAIVVNSTKIVIFSKYKNVYQSKVINELYGSADMNNGRITILYSENNKISDVYFQKSNFSYVDEKKITRKVVDISRLKLVEKLGGMEN